MTKRKTLICTIFLVMVMLLLSFSNSSTNEQAVVNAADIDKIVVSLVEAEVSIPVVGETVNMDAVINSDLYKATVTWYDITNDTKMNKYSKFVQGRDYSVSIRFQLLQHTSYTFDKENTIAKINGEEAVISSVSDGFLTAEITFNKIGTTTEKYSVTIENGTFEDGSTTGMFESGEKVNIIANKTPDGKVFSEWVITSGDAYISTSYKEETYLEVEDSDVVIKAVYNTIIEVVELTLKTPVEGDTLNDSTDLSFNGEKGYIATLSWSNKDYSDLESNIVTLGVTYRATIKVKTTDEYCFTDQTICYLNGLECYKFDSGEVSFELRELFTSTKTRPTYLDVIVNGGVATIDEDQCIKALQGTEITIVAEEKEGEEFITWEVVSGDVVLTNPKDSTTTFTLGSKSVEIKAVYKGVHIHNLELINEKKATCAQTGMKAHYKCSECNKLFDINNDKMEIEEDSLIIPLDHNAHNLFTEWTSSKEGHYHACKNVGCTVGHGEIEKHIPDRTSPTEADPVKCTVCDYIIEQALGHTHKIIHVLEKEATCTKFGTKEHYLCEDCGHKYTDQNGKTEITDEASLIIPMAHKFGKWIEEVPSTTDKFGTKAHKDCEYCHKHFDNNNVEIENLEIEKLQIEPTDSPKEGMKTGAVIAIVVGSVVVVSVASFSVVWFGIKKKSFSDLFGKSKK